MSETDWRTPVYDQTEAATEAVTDNQEATEMASTTDNTADVPSITVLGMVPSGDKLIKADWNGTTTLLSGRGIASLAKLGIIVKDDEADYLF